jgi:hypothetical protein
MLPSKVSSGVTEMKVRPGSRPGGRPVRNAQLQHLQDEIDRLALLVYEAKRQSDRIQAAADALGDAVLMDLENGAANEKRDRLRKIDS